MLHLISAGGLHLLQVDRDPEDLAGELVIVLLVVLGHRRRLIHADVGRLVG